MHRSALSFVALLALGTLAVSPVAAQVSAVPNSMNFQGRLAAPSGNPVPNGTHSMRFSLWNVASGGTAALNEKWNQTLANVTVRNGTFAVTLSGFAAGIFNGNLWLETKIGTDAALTPRQQLLTVAYAFKAGSVVDGSITGTSIANGTLNILNFPANFFNSTAWLLNGNSGTSSFNYVGTTDNVPLNLRVNGFRAMRYQYAENTASAGNEYRSINTLGGSSINSIGAGVVGATIAGGGRDYFSLTNLPNRVLGDWGTVSGGYGNTTSGSNSTVAGGYGNTASSNATIGGGSNNTASSSATIGGGSGNTASSTATIGGGTTNNASGVTATIGGGVTNTASGSNSTVAGGSDNTASNLHSFIGGGQGNTARDIYTTIAGGFNNLADNDYATIAGGKTNEATGGYAAIGGGSTNTASGLMTTVAGGYNNTAQSDYTASGGGYLNTVIGIYATIAGGINNTTDAYAATVPGGSNNAAGGEYSFAAGHSAKANHNGSFVWADSAAADFASSVSNQFNVRSSGGVRIYTKADLSIGVTLNANDSSWNSVSDRNAKTAFREIDPLDVLAKLVAIPITTWNYRGVENPIRHIGPMAQDFFAAFGVGMDDKHIGTIDADGVALAAIQGLNRKLEAQIKELRKRQSATEAENTELKATLAEVMKRLDALENAKK